jgi:hypothetical protein
MNLSRLNRDLNLHEKQQLKQEKNKTKKTSEIENLIVERHCSRATELAQPQNLARGLLTPPAWARGPTADGWAREAAQRCLPPGLKVAQPAARCIAAVDLRSTVENAPAQIGQV